MNQMSIDFLPEIEVPKLTVVTSYGGLPAKEVRELITIPLEDSFSSLKGIKHINSISRDGLTIIELEFHWGTDMVLAGVETREVIDLAYLTLPDDASKPQVLPVDPNDRPVISIGIFPKDGDLALARRIAEREIKTRLQKSTGVGTIQISGGLIEQIHISIDQDFLMAKGLTLTDISQALASTNISYPAGVINEGAIEYIVKTDGKAKTINDIKNYYIQSQNDSNPIQIKELGSVKTAYDEQHSVFMSDYSEGVLLSIRKQSGTSPIVMSKSVRTELENLKRSYGNILEFNIIEDTSLLVKESITNLVYSAVVGALFAFIILLLFLRNLPNSLLLIISLPISISWAIFLLAMTGRGLNIMSLGGLAMGIGMLVDNAIVVMERLSDLENKNTDNIIYSTTSLANSLVGSTITSLVVFIPVLFLPGVLGTLFSDLAFSVIFSLSASLVVAITLIPVLFKLWGKTGAPTKRNSTKSYVWQKIFKISFRKPIFTIVFVIILFISGGILSTTLPIEFLPSLNSGTASVKLEMPPGTSIDYMKDIGKDFMRQVKNIDYITSFSFEIGGETNDPYYLSNKEASTEIITGVITYNKNKTTFKKIRDSITQSILLNQGKLLISEPTDLLSSIIGIDSGREIWLATGESPEEARKKAENYILKHKNWQILPADKKTRITLYPDRELLAKNNLSVSTLSQFIGASLFGSIQSSFYSEGRDVDIKVQLDEKNRDSIQKLRNFSIFNQEGIRYKLEDLIQLKEENSLPYLTRFDRQDVSEILFAEKTTKEQKESLYNLNFISAGQSLINENISTIILVFSISLLLLYLTLGAQFESFILPIILLLTLPLGFTGIAFSLFIGRASINLNSILGILVLMGISVNNSILLYETFIARFKESNNILQSIYIGTKSRIRPIMMTMLTTTLALLPMVIDPAGTNTQSSMALAIIGGLLISTLLSLIVIPQVFYRYENRKNS